VEQKADADVKREIQLASLRHDIATAPKLEDIVKLALQAGADPQYIAYRYGVDLERCQRYVAALNKQKEIQREREESARGDIELPEIGQIVNGT
jgi:hypothetical protein